MKKFVRFMIALIAIILVTVLIAAIIEPKEVMVTRSVLIKAPKDTVFEQVVKFRNWVNWSPWYKMDPAAKLSYAGTDGQPGSSLSWDGSEKTGAGSFKDVDRNDTQMNYQIDIIRPSSYTSQGTIQVKDTAGMTKVTWNCAVSMSFPWNAAFAVLNMDKLLGGDFESGLANMKQYLESNHSIASQPAVEIKEVDYPAISFIGVRKTIGWADITGFFTESNALLKKEADDKITGNLTGLFYTWDTATKTTDAVAAFPVADTNIKAAGTAIIHVPAAKAYMAVQKGGYSASPLYHGALSRYMAEKGLKPGLVIEEYAVSPQTEPDSNKWVTNIYYLVQQ